jgi:hypothetical protein
MFAQGEAWLTGRRALWQNQLDRLGETLADATHLRSAAKSAASPAGIQCKGG